MTIPKNLFVQKRIKALEKALLDILPYAENEAEALHELKDCDIAEEEAARATMLIDKARALLECK